METFEIEQAYIFDEPVEYEDIKIHPVMVRDYYKFNYFAQCLTLEKNSIPDGKIISMTYLQYLYYLNTPENENFYIWMLRGLFSLCFKVGEDAIKFFFDENQKPIFSISGTRYDSSDFDKIRKIICEQNLVEVPDDTIQKEIRDKAEETRLLRAKINGDAKTAGFEDLMVSLSVLTALSIDSIYNLSVRKFNKMIERADHTMHYKIYLEASMSGMVTFKDKSFIKHWLSDLSKGTLDDVTMSLDDLRGHVGFEDLKK